MSCSGNTAPRRSSARIRWSATGTFLPPAKRSSASARDAFQRQRLSNIGEAAKDLFSQFRHGRGELAAAPRRLAEPERNRGRQPVRVLNPDFSRRDALDAPRVVAEKKNIAREALDREVLVDLADEGFVP